VYLYGGLGRCVWAGRRCVGVVKCGVYNVGMVVIWKIGLRWGWEEFWGSLRC
jgi:hypothetical protein